MGAEHPKDPSREMVWKSLGGESRKPGLGPAKKKRSFTVVGIGAGILLEVRINKKVKEDGGVFGSLTNEYQMILLLFRLHHCFLISLFLSSRIVQVCIQDKRSFYFVAIHWGEQSATLNVGFWKPYGNINYLDVV